MGREFHVRFREGLGVKCPRATRLVIGFSEETDARRVLEVLPKRFGKYGLTLHPDKTRLVPFVRPTQRPRPGDRAQQRPGTFDFLGFTHL
jgi:RNA-directed DNA polymerase